MVHFTALFISLDGNINERMVHTNGDTVSNKTTNSHNLFSRDARVKNESIFNRKKEV